MIEAAQKTLDIQYYAIHADTTTDALMQALRDAAARGVRIRILLDDLNTAGSNAQVLQLALVPGIEVRLFNPLPGSRQSQALRLLDALHDFNRIQRRMHNKIFVADNSIAITGGRNLGETYFGRGNASHFVDVDVLAAGPIVADLSRSFDQYWNNHLSYPVQSLKSRSDIEALARPASRLAVTGNDLPPGEGEPSNDGGREAERRAVAERARGFDLRQLKLTWAPALMLVDQPDKLDPEHEGSQEPTTIDGLMDLMRRAQEDLLIVSPYFVPGPQMMAVFGELRRRGVRIRVLTNSLASNDAPVAHVGYARYRKALLALGIELYEMRAEQPRRIRGLGTSGSELASLHAKVLVMDGQVIVVGSMNLDLRSYLQNSEVALVIRSRTLAAQATRAVEPTLGSGAYRLELRDGQLIWHAPAGMAAPTGWGEPDASVPLQLMLKIIGPFAPDEML
ncbi:MAG: Cardiolipin synthase C [Paracidovorax wautersii]|uniref:Cardiolipin synthase C n=1 Tax=Paracidovorax wautersii TaxID=1177982 RepID=A0A7V8FRN3_9BURK|nr:MAG: Cardiolipin synthase C [Paracidovorax wautersii]